ncbi:MAG: hypothetical protein HYU57_07275 [Micavibrio aeruginosavorus]|nr:hypothetical protein [Micavibrio aeruginosavorus]
MMDQNKNPPYGHGDMEDEPSRNRNPGQERNPDVNDKSRQQQQRGGTAGDKSSKRR